MTTGNRTSFLTLPANLPRPSDDGACDHLPGRAIPSVALTVTDGTTLDLQDLTKRPTVLFFYPRSGRPDEPAPEQWDEIPGARGCTPQACGFRDDYALFQSRGIAVFGVSTQTTAYQQEFATRMQLTYRLLSDASFELTDALRLPTFDYRGARLLKRMVWLCDRSTITHVFYPVFPPDQSARAVLHWLDAPAPK
ncbi:MAG: peroxiredoxin [Kofleriaceae bacterium]|nr:peroxiredoxin [Kofleriaceae bacterium]